MPRTAALACQPSRTTYYRIPIATYDVELTTSNSLQYSDVQARNTDYIDSTERLRTPQSSVRIVLRVRSVVVLRSCTPDLPISMSFRRIRTQTGSAHGRSPSHHSPYRVCPLMCRARRRAKPPKEARPEVPRPSAPHSLMLCPQVSSKRVSRYLPD